MAVQVFHFAPTIPAGAPITTPMIFNLTMPPGTVEAIEWRIPPGPNGAMGWSLGAAGRAVIPYNRGEWIIGDDDRDRWELAEQITSGAWQLFGYNTGTYDHRVFFTFLTRPPGITATPAPVAPLEAAV